MTTKPYEHSRVEHFELGDTSVNRRAIPAVSQWLKLSTEQASTLKAKLQSVAAWHRGYRVADASAEEVRNQIRAFASAAGVLESASAGLSIEARQLLMEAYALLSRDNLEATSADLIRSDANAIVRVERMASIAAQSLKPSSRGPDRSPQFYLARELLVVLRTVVQRDFTLGAKGQQPVTIPARDRAARKPRRVIRPDPDRTDHFRAIQFLMSAVSPSLTRSQRAGAIDEAYADLREEAAGLRK